MQREEIERARIDRTETYLHVDVDVAAVSADYILVKATVENRGNEPKNLSNALILVTPESEHPIPSFNRIAKAHGISEVSSTNQIARISLNEAIYTDDQALLPLPFFYDENVRIADERLSYRIPVRISGFQEGLPYSVRFLVWGRGRMHRSTHDSFIVPKSENPAG